MCFLTNSLRRLLVLIVFIALHHPLHADWPQFLGENRNGISDERGLIDSFGTGGPEVVWRVPGGVGMSAVAVANEYAVTMWNEGGNQTLVALDAKTGERVWEVVVGRAYKNQMGDGPRATPSIVDGIVYSFTGDGILSANKLESGEQIWSTNTVSELATRPAEYGMASSPLVVGNHVIVQVGSPNGSIAAFEKSDGKQSWTVGNATAAYSSPSLLSIAGENQVVCMTGFGAHGIDPKNGTELWRYAFKTPYDCNTASPVSVDGDVFISAGENHGCVMLRISKTKEGYQVSELWTSVNTKSVMRNEWQTSVLKDGYLYGFDNVGSAGPVTHLTCINAETGERAWQKTRFGKGNLVLADGKLWITTMDGDLVLVQATENEFKELGRAKLFGKTRQSLSISNGRGYIRDDKDVICVRLSK